MIELLKQYCRLLDYYGSAMNQILHLSKTSENKLLQELFDQEDPLEAEPYIYSKSEKNLIFSGYNFTFKTP